MELASIYPQDVNDEDIDMMDFLVKEEELVDTLKEVAKDKISCLDGWPIELYLSFFDIMG